MNEKLIEMLTETYIEVLRKNYKYQMGDDDYQPSTAEMKIIDAVQIIIEDLKNKN
jgi:hypothetical protein